MALRQQSLRINEDFSAGEAGGHPLTDLTESLARVVTSSEDAFLELGMNLQKIQMLSSGQRQKIAATMNPFRSGEQDGILQQLSAYVRQNQQETAAAQQQAAGLCTSLVKMMQLMDSIATRSEALERSGLFLHVIGINTGIECARHHQMEAMFKVVSSDTIQLAGQIKKSTEALLDQTRQARQEQEQTLQGARQNIDSLQELARTSNQATQTALDKVGELVDYSINMASEAERIAQGISAGINQVVVGIQFHDNLRQRIEHVNQALLETLTEENQASTEELCNSYLSVELQQAQLETLIDELERLFSTQSQALANIVADVTSLEERLGGMGQKSVLSSGQANPVAMLLHGLQTLEEINGRSLTLGADIQRSAEQSERIAGEMQSAVKDTFAIANHVKINALNAIIKAAKFGPAGESLQVLAQGMVGVSREVRELVAVFEELLETLGQLAGGDSQSDEDTSNQAAAEDFDTHQLERLFDSFRQELLACRDDCHQLNENLEQEHRGLDFIRELKQQLQQRAGWLADYAEKIRPLDSEQLESLRSRFGQELAERYTMNEERDIHAKVLQLAPGAIAAAALLQQAPANTAASDDSVLWDDQPAETTPDIELFDPPPAEQTDGNTAEVELWGALEPPATEAVEEPASDGIELWDESPAVEQTADEPEPLAAAAAEENSEKQDFGDNIELF